MISHYRISRSIALLKWLSIPPLVLATTIIFSFQMLLLDIDRVNNNLTVNYADENSKTYHRATVQPIVAQGDMVLIERPDSKITSNVCTIGYVDKEKRRAYLSAHCGHQGARVKSEKRAFLGTLHRSPNKRILDIGYIELTERVHILPNDFADHYPDSPKPHIGQTICQYSRNARQTGCSKIAFIDGRQIRTLTKMTSSPGDSGGPVWIPTPDGRHHIIAIHSGHNNQKHYPKPMSRSYLLEFE